MSKYSHVQSGQREKSLTIPNVLKNKDFKFMAVENGSTHQMLKSFHDPIHEEVLQRMNTNKDSSWKRSYTEGFKELLEGNTSDVGIVIEGQVAEYFASRHCNLYSVGSLTSSYYSLGFPKGS